VSFTMRVALVILFIPLISPVTLELGTHFKGFCTPT
jgi:hypothetical protein